MTRHPLFSIALGFVMALAVLAAATLWHVRAPLLRAMPAHIAGSERAHASASGSDAVLFVGRDAIAAAARSARFGTLDLSWGWVNTLAQEVGPVRVLDAAEGVGDRAFVASLVVWSRSACATSDARTAEWLGALAERGTVVVIDGGDCLWELTGVRPDPDLPDGPVPRQARSGPLPSADGPLGISEAEALGGLDLPIDVLAGQPADGEVLLTLGGRPAALRRRVGNGAVVALLYDHARLVTSLQQGVPEDDLRVVNRYPHRLADRVESNDLVASEMLLENNVPYADLLERLVLGWVDAVRPLPSWWGYPDGSDGAFLMTHDDEGFGDRSRWMTEYEARIGAASTSLFMPSGSLTAPGLAAMLADGTEVGIHWDRTATGRGVDEFFLGPWRVFRVEKTLTKQITWLRTLLPEATPVRSSRSHFLQWGDTWTGTFRELAAADIAIDSTYGVDFGTRGYLFGTGRPFRPLDDNGLPFPLLEIPQIGSENLGGFDAAFLEKLLTDSRDSYHQALTVLFHPSDMSWIPSVDLYRHFLSSYERAREAGHAIVTMAQMAGFEAARAASPLRSSWDGRILRIDGEANGDGMSLALPETGGGRGVLAVRGAGGPLPFRTLPRMGRRAFLVAVPRGPVALEAVYGEAR